MNFQETLAQIQALLAAQGRVSYRALKRQFDLDDDFIEDLKFELIEVLQVATDQDEKMLVWGGATTPIALASPAVPPPAITVPEAERRQLTVMFCDLVGSTELSEKLDPEDLRELLLTYQRVSADAIASVEGFIAKYMGDGLLVYFGYPVAHEEDARRALRSGLQILQAIETINPQIQQKYGVTVSVRIGIHTGLVIAGEMGAGETLEKLAVVGDTPNIAARLQGVAEPGMLVISAATHRLIAAFFDCESLGKHALRGIAEPIEVFHVRSESGTQSRFEAAEKSSLTPLRGRDSEIETLLSCWHAAKSESSQAILLRGEAGVGKSRLLWELKNHVRQEGDVWLTECFCSPFSSSTALFPVIDLLERVELKLERHDTPAQRRAKIEGFLATYDLETPENAALLASLLSVPLEEAYAPVALAPDKQMQRLMEIFVVAVQRRAEQQPVLLIVEDLHWVDASTLDLIERLLRQAGTARLLVLLTSRLEFHSPWDADVALETLTLERLSEGQTREIVERLTASKPLPPEVVAQIIQKTDGVPLFVEELTRTVLEQGGLVDKGTHYELDGTLGMLAIPTTLHDSLIARLDRLPQAVRELAQLGSVLGREFSYEQIAAITFLTEPELRTSLAHLSDADLLFQMGTPPVARYKFKHALIQDAAYQSLLKTRRQQFHAHIAQVLTEHFTEAMANQPETLAHHYSEAANPAMAVTYWDRASLRALERAANREAIANLTRGLEQLNLLPKSRECDVQELAMLLRLAPAYMAIKGWAAVEVEETCVRARDLSREIGDGQSLFGALWGLWTVQLLRGQMLQAKAIANEVLEMAQAANIPMLLVMAYHAQVLSDFYSGNYESAAANGAQGIALFDMEMERVITSQIQLSSSAALRVFYGKARWHLGYPEEAEESVQSALELALDLEHAPSIAYARGAQLCFYHFEPYFVDKSIVSSDSLLKISTEEGFLIWIPMALYCRGAARVRQGDYNTGVEDIQQGITLWQGTGTSMILTHIRAMYAEALIGQGKLPEALAVIDEGIEDANRRGEHHFEPELLRLRATALRQSDKPAEAEESLQQACALARSQKARMLELRASSDLARLWQAQGKTEAAVALLTPLCVHFSEGINATDYKDARSILVQLVGREVTTS